MWQMYVNAMNSTTLCEEIMISSFMSKLSGRHALHEERSHVIAHLDDPRSFPVAQRSVIAIIDDDIKYPNPIIKILPQFFQVRKKMCQESPPSPPPPLRMTFSGQRSIEAFVTPLTKHPGTAPALSYFFKLVCQNPAAILECN